MKKTEKTPPIAKVEEDIDWSVDPEDPDAKIHTPATLTPPALATGSRFPDQLGSRTFFYPACDVDWQPLHRFTHLCDTFVYCDMQADSKRFDDFKSVIKQDIPPGVGLRVESVQDIKNDDVRQLAEPSGMEFNVPGVESPWGKSVRLVRTVGAVERKITLFYLRAEGVTLYTNLFSKRGVAPRVVCVKGRESDNWTTFRLWDGFLGRALWDNPAQPQIVVADGEQPEYDWPWSKVWQHHIGWAGERKSVTSYVLPSSLPTPVGVKRWDMKVHGDAEGWLHNLENEQKALIVLDTPEMNERPLTNPLPVPKGERDFPVWNQNANLSGALQQLSKFIQQTGAQRVGWSGGVRFEDEGPALTEWKNSGFPHPRRLTIHCRTEGDVYSFGPYADAIC